MLTYTYSQVTLSLEQQKARNMLRAIREGFGDLAAAEDAALSAFNTLVDRLIEFDTLRHRRIVEMYLIPAVCEATREADTLLAQLDFLSASGVRLFEQVKSQTAISPCQDPATRAALCAEMERYCDSLLQRLDMEEQQLFPIARRVISTDGWFHIASQFISHREEMRQSRVPFPAPHAAAHPQAALQTAHS
jgi:hemerythrin-like domain-containing protein